MDCSAIDEEEDEEEEDEEEENYICFSVPQVCCVHI
jgi:hypothetical protein